MTDETKVLIVTLPPSEDALLSLRALIRAHPGATLAIDLETQPNLHQALEESLASVRIWPTKALPDADLAPKKIKGRNPWCRSHGKKQRWLSGRSR